MESNNLIKVEKNNSSNILLKKPQDLDLSALDKLTPEERSLALSILQEYSVAGKSQKLNDLLLNDYEEIPVDIDTFLHDPKYLGNGLIDKEGRFTVFPYWVKTLKKIFPTNIDTAYNTLILTGGIGLGKSFIAVLCELYLLYRMICLKDPYTHYGLQPIDKITFSLINITLDAAKGVAWDKMQQLLQSSEWFMNHGVLKKKDGMTWEPPKGIELIVGSQNRHVIGRAVFANFTDEVNFGVSNDIDKLKKKQMTLISQVDARMQSRFMKGVKLPTLQIIASSKNSEQSFLETYIDLKRRTESKTTLIIDEPQWVIRNDKDSPIKFWVAVGNKFLASEVLPKDASEDLIDEYRHKGYEMLQVPIGYYQAFIENVDIALTDIAGKSTSSSTKFISGIKWNEIKTKSYRNPFTQEILEIGNDPRDMSQYYDYFDLSAIPTEMRSKPLFIHLDMSISGDRTGIVGTWIKGKLARGESDLSKELYYKVAFSVAIKAPKGFQVSFSKNRQFIKWLKRQGFAIKAITSDTFQAAQLQQELAADGFNVSILSVDRLQSIDTSGDEKDENGASVSRHRKVCIPYQYLKTTIYEHKLEIYDKCDLLTNEIVGLEKEADGHINHPDNGRSGSKDIADALCGSIYQASHFAEEFAFDYGETMEQILLANSDYRFEDVKSISTQLEDELKLLDPTLKPTHPSNATEFTKRTDYNLYSDILIL